MERFKDFYNPSGNGNASKVPTDPFNLLETGEVNDIEDMKNLNASVYCAVSDQCTSFDLKVFLGNADLQNGTADGENAKEMSFEDIKMINMKEEF